MGELVRRFFIIVLLLPMFGLVYAQNDKDIPLFDLEKAALQSKIITTELDKKNISEDEITQGITQLEALLQLSDDCVSNSNDKADAISIKIKQYFGPNTNKLKTVDLKYLEERREKLVSTAAMCRLFGIKTKEKIEEYRDTLLSMKKEITFTRGENLYTRIQTFSKDWEKLQLPEGNQNKLEDMFKVRVLLFSLTLLFVANIITYLSRSLMRRKWRKQKLNFVLNVCFIFLTLNFSIFYFMAPAFFKAASFNTLVKEIYILSACFFCALFLVRLFFSVRRLPKLDKFYYLRHGTIRFFSLLAVFIYFAQKIGVSLLTLWQSPKDIVYIYQDIILLLSLITLLSFIIYYIYKNKSRIERYIKISILCQVIVTTTVILVTFDFLGYNLLAINIAYIIYSILFIAVIGTLTYTMLDKFYDLCSHDPKYQASVKYHFGYNTEPPYLELMLLNMIGKVLLLIGLCHLFAYLIGEASYFIDKVLLCFFEGFHISGLFINPFQWFIALSALCLMSLLARKASTLITQHHQFDKSEEKRQVALASITLYVGIAIAIIVSLLIAGFHFRSLTIIAGALSVGIGLGLQSVVNNFVCGLILLIEKPVKTGDRIQIGNIEGFVKKIRVRSTRLVTPAKEDVIIPNADFITQQVTNYMFRDKVWRIVCKVGVAYGSDVKLVEKIMLEVAREHPEVMQKAPNLPYVYFREFGDHALLFELWCFIKNVNTKHKVSSQLHFALDQAFRENNITIAFPQQDVHLKLDEKDIDLLTKE